MSGSTCCRLVGPFTGDEFMVGYLSLLPHDCVRAAIAVATWLCVCLSHRCIMPKRLSRSSCDLRPRIRGFLNDMRYINSRFTYLLTYLLTVLVPIQNVNLIARADLSH